MRVRAFFFLGQESCWQTSPSCQVGQLLFCHWVASVLKVSQGLRGPHAVLDSSSCPCSCSILRPMGPTPTLATPGALHTVMALRTWRPASEFPVESGEGPCLPGD